MHLTPEQFAIMAVAFALAVVRLLTASKPFWNATPFAKYLTILGPAALAAFATLPAALTGAHSWVDVGVALLTVASVGFAAAHGDKTQPAPPVSQPVDHIVFPRQDEETDPPTAAIKKWRHPAWRMALVCLLLTGCGARIDWPKVATCGEPLEGPVVQSVASVLVGTGDVKTELEGIASQYGAGVIECVVKQIVSDMATGPTTARASRAAARGRAFLAEVQK